MNLDISLESNRTKTKIGREITSPAIAGVVILYHPGKDVYDNIMTYIDSLNVLYVVDNSEHENEKVITTIKSIPNIKYIKHAKNMGIAKSLNEVLNIVANKYEWLLTMDQDTKFKKGTFRKYLLMLPCLPNNGKVYGFTPRYKGGDDLTVPYKISNWCITSGNIINVSIALKCGGFDENLFIDSVDEEFCLRCNKRGFLLYEYTKEIMIQKVGNPRTIKIGSLKICTTTNHNYIRLYYIMRNALYVSQKYPETVKHYYSMIIRRIVKIILFESDKIRKLHFIKKGFIDFFQHKMGKLDV